MRLIEYRTMLGWSQSELARRAGISAPTVSKAEEGLPINGRSAGLICKALSQAMGKQIMISDVTGWKVKV
jgi:transcriptional regulator with XRE-family HTH domain